MPTTIALHNQKGGVGKTTASVCLGAALAESGDQVVLIDLDPQADASRWLQVAHSYVVPISSVLSGQADINSAIEPTGVDNLRILPASDRLRDLGEPVIQFEDALNALESDWAIVDCPPSWSPRIPYSQIGVRAADYTVVPVTPSSMDLDGLERTRENVESYTSDDRWWVLYSKVDRRVSYTDTVEQRLRRSLPNRLCPVEIRTNIKLAEAPDHGPITEYATSSRGADDFRNLTSWIQETMQ